MVTNTNFEENENPSFVDGCNIDGKRGTYVKGEDVIHLDAPEICFSCSSEDTDTELKIKPCGDGLYYFGGDLFCAYKLLGTTINENSVVFDYAPYTVTVSWTNSGNKRTNPTWQRVYK